MRFIVLSETELVVTFAGDHTGSPLRMVSKQNDKLKFEVLWHIKKRTAGKAVRFYIELSPLRAIYHL